MSNSLLCAFVKRFFLCFLLALSPVVFASENHKIIGDVKGISNFQNHHLGEKLRSFSSRQGVTVYGKTMQAKAEYFLKTYSGDFSKASTSSQFRMLKAMKSDRLGFISAQYQQSVANINVTGSYINISMKGDKVRSVFSNLIDELPVDLKLAPTLTKDSAKSIAKKVIAKYQTRDMRFAKSSEPVLELFNWELISGASNPTKTKLVWYVELTSLNVREQVWIDAHSGKLINRINNLHSAKNRQIYDSQSSFSAQNVLVRSEGDEPVGDVDVDLAYDFSGDTYDYFFDEHSLDSYDGQGAPMISNVYYCDPFSSCPTQNAFWDGSQMLYGQGFVVDDIVAHELTHAVIEHSADLIYQNQSGALNESYADIFGETVDLVNGAGNDATAQRWLIGEGLSSNIGAIRNMSNPSQFGDPQTVSDTNYFCGTFDNGGVHINSGVPNKAFSLMVDGGTFNGFTVNGIGLDKAGKVQYRALSTYLGPSSTFLDNYNALISSCSDLVGSSGISLSDCDQVKAAIDAVEMNGEICAVVPPITPEPLGPNAFCPENTTQSVYFSEGFESINANDLTTSASAGPNMWTGCQGLPDVYCNNEPNNGSYNLSGNDVSEVSDSVVTLPAFVVSPNSFVSFDHKYDFESGFDGAVVEYSLNGSETWVDALGLFSSGIAYNRTISSGFSNPLSGRSAFTGEVEGIGVGYLRTVLNLSLLEGSTVQFRFRIGTDVSVSGFDGWRVDDVIAYQCSADQGSDILDFLPAIIQAVKKND